MPHISRKSRITIPLSEQEMPPALKIVTFNKVAGQNQPISEAAHRLADLAREMQRSERIQSRLTTEINEVESNIHNILDTTTKIKIAATTIIQEQNLGNPETQQEILKYLELVVRSLIDQHIEPKDIPALIQTRLNQAIIDNADLAERYRMTEDANKFLSDQLDELKEVWHYNTMILEIFDNELILNALVQYFNNGSTAEQAASGILNIY